MQQGQPTARPTAPGRRRRRTAGAVRSGATGITLAIVGVLAGLTVAPGTGIAGAAGTAGTAGTPKTAGPAAPGTAAPPSPATPSTDQSSIDAAEAQVASLSAQISQQQAVLDQYDEEYNQAQVVLNTTQTSLHATTTQIDTARAQLGTERAHLRNDAIQAYMDDTSSNSVSSLFAAPSGASQVRQYYQQIGSTKVADDVTAIRSGQKRLTDVQRRLLAEQQAETAQLAQVDTARQSAQAVSAQSEATLAQVKGTLAAQITQQAEAQAQAAAQAAASATTPAQAQAAAAQAAQAAQVASTVGAGSAAAVNATAAANQAASAAGAGTVAVASSGSAQAAGLAAVHGAMHYLGVPYVWGGASAAGLDCSGLTMLAWRQAGVYMDHSAADQYAMFPHVPLNALEPGDLLFFDFDGTGIDHVVMYVGPYLDGRATPYGSGTIIQAAHTGTFVAFNPLWYQGLVGAARP